MRTLVLNISGMMCDNCVEHVEHSLKLVRGVRDVEIDLLSRTARVNHDERACSLGDMVTAVKRVGYQVSGFQAAEVSS